MRNILFKNYIRIGWKSGRVQLKDDGWGDKDPESNSNGIGKINFKEGGIENLNCLFRDEAFVGVRSYCLFVAGGGVELEYGYDTLLLPTRAIPSELDGSRYYRGRIRKNFLSDPSKSAGDSKFEVRSFSSHVSMEFVKEEKEERIDLGGEYGFLIDILMDRGGEKQRVLENHFSGRKTPGDKGINGSRGALFRFHGYQ